MHPVARNLLVSLFGLALFLLQSVEAKEPDPENGCVLSEGAAQNKAAVEQSLLPKVRFAGESDTKHSVGERMEALKVPGLSFALIEGGRIGWSEAYGVERVGENTPITCDTLFQAASLAKPVTLIAAMRMQESGLIDLDTDIQSYLKEYKLPAGGHSADNPVTFRNILSHTSGLAAGGYAGYAQNAGFPTDIEVLMGSGVANTARLEAPQAPGVQLAYSGGGYTVAEVAMQDVTDASFTETMQEWILRPAGMNHSHFEQPLPISKYKKVARGHDTGGIAVKGGWHNHPEQAAAGLWSTAGDMATFLVEIFKSYRGDGDVLSQETVRRMMADRRDGHIYGFVVESGEQWLSIRHYGANVGYRGFMMIHLETGDGAAYLTNSDNGIALGEEMLLGVSRVYGWPSYHQMEVTRAQRTAEELAELVGVYEFDGGLRVSIDYRASENAIGINFPNGDRYSLTPISGESEFIHPETGVEVSFATEEKNRTLTVYGGTAIRVDQALKELEVD